MKNKNSNLELIFRINLELIKETKRKKKFGWKILFNGSDYENQSWKSRRPIYPE